MTRRLRIALAALLLLTAAVILYGRAPQNGRMPEDDLAIWSNRAVAGSSWTETAVGRYFDPRRDGYRPAVRPLALLVHRLEYLAFENERSGYIWVHILLAGACAFLFFLTMLSSGLVFTSAGLAGLLLLVHPVGASVVLGLAGTSELLAVLFGLWGWSRVLPTLLGTSTEERQSWLAPALLFALAALSGEIGYLFGAAALILLWIRQGTWRPTRPLWWIGGAILLPLFHRLVVMATLPHHLRIGHAVELGTGLGVPLRWLVGLGGVAEFARLLVYPWRISYTNDFLRSDPALPLRAAIGLVLLLALLVLLVRGLRRRSGLEANAAALLLLLALVGATGLVFPTGALVPPRLFFAALPGALGLIFLSATRIGRNWGREARMALGIGLAMAAALPLGVRAWLRVQEHQQWSNLVVRQTETFPLSAQGWFDRGNLALTRREYVAAIQYYEKATEIWPEYWAAWINMGAAYGEHDERGLAIRAYEKVLVSTKGRPEFRAIEARASFNRAVMLMTQVRNVEAAQGFENMLEVFPDHLISHANLGMLYSNSEHLDARSSEHLTKALSMETDPERRKMLQDFLDGIQRRRDRRDRNRESAAPVRTNDPATQSDGWDLPDSTSR